MQSRRSFHALNRPLKEQYYQLTHRCHQIIASYEYLRLTHPEKYEMLVLNELTQMLNQSPNISTVVISFIFRFHLKHNIILRKYSKYRDSVIQRINTFEPFCIQHTHLFTYHTLLKLIRLLRTLIDDILLQQNRQVGAKLVADSCREHIMRWWWNPDTMLGRYLVEREMMELYS